MLLVLAISVTAFITVANVQLTGETRAYRTYFAYIGGLDSGNVVRFGGRKAGLIEDVRPWREDMTKSEVVFSLRAELPVTEDSVATIASLSALARTISRSCQAASRPGASSLGGRCLPSKRSVSRT